MLTSKIFEEYLLRHPIYNDLFFSASKKADGEKLHPIFVLTQHIIDSLIDKDEKRIAVILPDNECSIIPLIVAKYFSNIQYEQEYAGSVLDECHTGQRLRLGKAVVEFLSIDRENNQLRFIVGGKTKLSGPITHTTRIEKIYNLFEKTEGAISSVKTWENAKKKAYEDEAKMGSTAELFKAKRTALKKTILLLTIKDDFKDYVDELRIDDISFEDILSYAEIDTESESGFRLFNKGRLDCLPALSVTSKIDEVATLLRDEILREKIFAVFTTADKFNELINNRDTLIKCLRHNIPFIVFLPETEFENYPVLSEMGFELWHWKPSTMRSEIFLSESIDEKSRPLFGRISAKATKAALADYDTEICRHNGLKNTLFAIRKLSDLVKDSDAGIRKVTRQLLTFQFNIQAIICESIEELRIKLQNTLREINNAWKSQKRVYAGQEVARIIDELLLHFEFFVSENKLSKAERLLSRLKSMKQDINVTILVSDKYEYLSETQRYYKQNFPSNRIVILKLSDFYQHQNMQIDYLLITWFDKEEYIKIRQTYCYDKLIFVLYDFENKWKQGFAKKFNECLPHEYAKKNAEKIGMTSEEVSEMMIDIIPETHIETLEYKEIEDYNFQRNIIHAVVKSDSVNAESVDSVECLPIILSGDNIGYFYPTHDVIEISGILSSDSFRPLKKEAGRLRKGDRILIRQSGKDIIKEKADELLAVDGKSELREIASIWQKALEVLSCDKSESEICSLLNRAGGACSVYQVRYWLFGETICPENKNNITAIAKVSTVVDFEANVDVIYDAGKMVQAYHVQAGRWLTSALKEKASEIKEIVRSSGLVSKGKIEGIGEIVIYTVEEVLEKSFVSKSKINRTEALD